MVSLLRVFSVCIVVIWLRSIDTVSDEYIVNGETNEEGRIIGGETSAEGAWPFMASIGRPKYGRSRKHICGGVVWDDETILTAAHCISHSTTGVIEHNLRGLNVYLGNTDLSVIDSTYLFKVKSVEVHPLGEARKDIAIVKLEEKIDFGGKHRKVSCICNPEPLSELNSSACIAIGWGLTKRPNPRPNSMFLPSKLQQVQQEIQSHSVCKETRDKYPEMTKYKYDPLILLCAGTTEEGASRGDSGGPLVCQVKAHPQKYSLVGITSFGQLEGPGFFTRVWTFMDWIEKAVAGNGTENSTEQALADSIVGEGHLVKLALLGSFVGIVLLLVGVACCRRKQLTDSAKKTSSMKKSSKLDRKITHSQSKISSILSKGRSKKEKISIRNNSKSFPRKLSSTRAAKN